MKFQKKLALCLASLTLFSSTTFAINPKETQLIEAIESNDINTARQIIESNPNLVNSPIGSDGGTCLLWASVTNHKEIVELLLNHDANPNIQDNEGFTPLHAAIENNCIGIVSLLLSRGANPNLQNNEGITPLHWAAFEPPRVEILELLLQQTNINLNTQNTDGTTPLYAAVCSRNREIVNSLLSRGANPNIQDNNGNTPLHAAVHSNNKKIVRLLLTHGANPNIQDYFGDTPLHIVVKEDGYRDEIVRLLLNHGANPNLKGLYGWTPLHGAVVNNKVLVTELLLARGANPNIRDDQGHTCQDLLPRPQRPQRAQREQRPLLHVEDFPQDEFRRSLATGKQKACPMCLGEFGAEDLCCIFDCQHSENYPFGHYLCNECAQELLDDNGQEAICPFCLHARLKPHN